MAPRRQCVPAESPPHSLSVPTLTAPPASVTPRAGAAVPGALAQAAAGQVLIRVLNRTDLHRVSQGDDGEAVRTWRVSASPQKVTAASFKA